MDLKPCPCGLTPEQLCISDGLTYRWRYVTGDCCNEWIIEARVTYSSDEEKVYAECVEAWNEKPRAEKCPAS